MIEADNHHRVFLQMLHSGSNLTQKTVLALHKEIFSQTKPRFAGQIRTERVYVTGSKSTFPHPKFVPSLLREFFIWSGTKKIQNPVEFAALAHFRFVSIHPFGDGNGRISRLLMNQILHKHGYPMLNIKFTDRRKYYSALELSQTEMDEIHFLKWFVSYYVAQNRKYLKDRS